LRHHFSMHLRAVWVSSVGDWYSDASSSTLYFVLLALFFFLVIGIFFFIVNFEIYKLHPAWAPMRQFDAPGNEDLRINQLLLHHNVRTLPSKYKVSGQAHDSEKAGPVSYGAIGACTWGHCEPSWAEKETVPVRLVPGVDPRPRITEQRPGAWEKCQEEWYGGEHTEPSLRLDEVRIHKHHAETQYVRAHCQTWARDEPFFMESQGVTTPSAPSFGQGGTDFPQRMV